MRKICEWCAYKDSDCKGDKEHGKGCKFYKKPNVFNAKEAAERIGQLERENIKLNMQLEFISRMYGIDDCLMDRIAAAVEMMRKITMLHKAEINTPICNELERVIEEWEKLK